MSTEGNYPYYPFIWFPVTALLSAFIGCVSQAVVESNNKNNFLVYSLLHVYKSLFAI